MRTELSIEIDRPFGEVIRYTTQNAAEWSPTVLEERLLQRAEGDGGA